MPPHMMPRAHKTAMFTTSNGGSIAGAVCTERRSTTVRSSGLPTMVNDDTDSNRGSEGEGPHARPPGGLAVAELAARALHHHHHHLHTHSHHHPAACVNRRRINKSRPKLRSGRGAAAATAYDILCSWHAVWLVHFHLALGQRRRQPAQHTAQRAI